MSQFPKPWRSIEGSYSDTVPSLRWRMNDRDVAKVATTTILLQPFLLATSGGIEQLAHLFQPTVAQPAEFSFAFLRTWVW